MSVSVNIDLLISKYGIDPDAFESGQTYPLSKLMKELGLQQGTPKLRIGG